MGICLLYYLAMVNEDIIFYPQIFMMLNLEYIICFNLSIQPLNQ